VPSPVAVLCRSLGSVSSRSQLSPGVLLAVACSVDPGLIGSMIEVMATDDDGADVAVDVGVGWGTGCGVGCMTAVIGMYLA